MSITGPPYAIYLEIAARRVFAVALNWPGWCRPGRDEAGAVRSLLEYAPRYALIADFAGQDFHPPQTESQLDIALRLEGNATTDFGAPDALHPRDWEGLDAEDLGRSIQLLEGCWQAFDRAAQRAAGKTLRKGPRGGGRDLGKIVAHVVEAEQAYLRVLGWKQQGQAATDLQTSKADIRREVLSGLQAAADGRLPKEGPRGGKRWPPRYFVRRLAWHAADHAWEIEDRISA